MYRSDTTWRPAARAGRTTSATCWPRSAAMSNASARSSSCAVRASSSNDRRALPTAVPPGSRVWTAPMRAASRADWVDFPLASPPSKTMNRATPLRRGLLGRGLLRRRLLGGRLLRSRRLLGGRLLGGARLLGRRLLGGRLPGRPLAAPGRRARIPPGRQQLGGPVQGQALDSVAVPLAQRGIGLAVGGVGTEAAVLDHDRLAAHRVGPQLPQRGGRRP